MCETPNARLDLRYLVSRMDATLLDIVLVEGFKDEPVPKIILWRAGVKGEDLPLLDEHVIAVASDSRDTDMCPCWISIGPTRLPPLSPSG